MFNNFILKDLSNICESYLLEDEQIYYKNEWNNFDKNKVCDIAAENGWLDLLMWAQNNEYPHDCRTFLLASEHGHLSILKWSFDNGLQEEWVPRMSTIAAKNGHLEIVKLLFTISPHLCNEWTCSYAAMFGHIEILKWLINNGCPYDEFTYKYAAQFGYLEILKWIREKEQAVWNRSICWNALESKNIEILKWLKGNGCTCGGQYHKE